MSRSNIFKGVLFIILLVVFTLPNTASAVDRRVPGDYATIQLAIDAANAGDRVLVSADTYTETITFGAESITVESLDGPETTFIDNGGACDSVVIFNTATNPPSVLDGFTIHGSDGGIEILNASPTIQNCIITDNSVFECSNGAIFISSGDPTFINCAIVGNDSEGIRYTNSSLTITNCTIADNTEPGLVGWNAGDPTITNTIFYSNWDGSAEPLPLDIRHNGTGTITISESNIDPALVSNIGAGTVDTTTNNIDIADPLFVDDANATILSRDYRLTLDSPCRDIATISLAPATDFEGEARPYNSLYDIGCDEFQPRTITVPGDHTTIGAAITASLDGDTILVDEDTYQENIVFGGKQITLKSTGRVSHTIIDGTRGDTVVKFNNNETSTSVIDGFTLYNGSGTNGGGIYCSSADPTIKNCIIIDNLATDGAGIFLSGSDATIINCVIVNNDSTFGYAGGIYCTDSNPSITNCTIAYNLTSSFYGLGGIVAENGSTATVINSILYGNQKDGGLNEIFEEGGSAVNVSYSDVQQATGIRAGTGNINANPLFVDISNANKLLNDYHLQETSPCIDTGFDDPAATHDLDGTTRPLGSKHDLGAYEMRASEPYIGGPARYTMMAFPLILDDTDPVNNLGPIFNTTAPDPYVYNPNVWRIYTYSSGSYVQPPDPLTALVPGGGYWIVSLNDASIDLQGPAVDSSSDYSITLTPGWNMIGNPFTFAVEVADLDVTDGSSTVSVASGTMTLPNVYFYDVNHYVTVSYLLMNRGYWIKNTTAGNITLKVPPIPAIPLAVGMGGISPAAAAGSSDMPPAPPAMDAEEKGNGFCFIATAAYDGAKEPNLIDRVINFILLVI